MVKHQCSYCVFESPYPWVIKRHANAKHKHQSIVNQDQDSTKNKYSVESQQQNGVKNRNDLIQENMNLKLLEDSIYVLKIYNMLQKMKK